MNEKFESESDQTDSLTENSLTVLTVFATIAAVVFFAFGKDGDESGKETESVGVGATIPDSYPTDFSDGLQLQPVFLPINPIEPIPPYPLAVNPDASFREVCEVLAIAESIIFVQDYRLETISKTDPTEIRDRQTVERDVIELIRERMERIDWTGARINENGVDEMDARREMYLRVLDSISNSNSTHP